MRDHQKRENNKVSTEKGIKIRGNQLGISTGGNQEGISREGN